MNKEKFSFLLPILVFFMVFLMLAGWFFALSRIYLIKNDILILRGELMGNEKKAMETRSLKNIIAGIEEKKMKIGSLFLSRDELIYLIEGLESLGKNSGVEMKMNSISGGGKEEKPRVSFSIEGNFNQVFQYLYRLDNFPYLLNIEKASFDKIKIDKGNKSKWQVFFDISLESYEIS